MGLRGLLERGIVRLALLPSENDFLLSDEGRDYRGRLLEGGDVETWHATAPNARNRFYDFDRLDSLSFYTVPVIEHDYQAKTPIMWNRVYSSLGLKGVNIMVVGDKKDAETIFRELAADPKYLGGGAGVGFKEVAIDAIRNLGGEIVPRDLKSVNILVNEAGRLRGYNTDADGLLRAIGESLADIPRSDGDGNKALKGSNVILMGARGVGKEVARRLADRGVRHITIVNRTYSEATKVAEELNGRYGQIAEGVGEHLLRGAVLNSFVKPDVIINSTEKGSDTLPEFSAFGFASLPPRTADGYDDLRRSSVAANENLSRQIVRELVNMNPDVLVVDAVLPPKLANGGKTVTLRHVENEWERKDMKARTLDGTPMVVYQAVDAYKLIETAWPGKHKSISEGELLQIMASAAGLKR
jgi:shikimate 5-dehydrogenase